MSPETRSAAPLVLAAVSGLVAGVSGCGSADAKNDAENGAKKDDVPANTASAAPAPSASGSADAGAKKACCSSKNECKGKGGCKTDKNGCKGKNECKGKGGCSMRDCT